MLRWCMVNDLSGVQAAQLAMEEGSADGIQHALTALRAEVAALKEARVVIDQEGAALLLKLQMEVAEKAILSARIQSQVNKFADWKAHFESLSQVSCTVSCK